MAHPFSTWTVASFLEENGTSSKTQSNLIRLSWKVLSSIDRFMQLGFLMWFDPIWACDRCCVIWWATPDLFYCISQCKDKRNNYNSCGRKLRLGVAWSPILWLVTTVQDVFPQRKASLRNKVRLKWKYGETMARIYGLTFLNPNILQQGSATPSSSFSPFRWFRCAPKPRGQHTSRSLKFCEHVKRRNGTPLKTWRQQKGVEVPTVECFSLVHQAEKNTCFWFFCVYKMYGLADQLSLSNCYLHVMFKNTCQWWFLR